MDQTNPLAGPAAVFILGIGGSVAAVGFLWLEFRRRFRRACLLSGGLALLLALGGSAAWAASQPSAVWGSAAILAAVCGTAFVLHWPASQKAISYLTSPKAVWVLVLAASPASATLLAWSLNRPDECPAVAPCLPMEREEIVGCHVLTDAGRPIRVYSLVVSTSATEFERAYIAERDLACRVIRTGDADSSHNCHGWVFTHGRFALNSEDVKHILADNQYEEVDKPQPGDLIVYRNVHGEIEHTGLVRTVIDGEIVLIESKWGPLGRFLHAPEDQPYGPDYAFYRSPRPGHLLTVVEQAQRMAQHQCSSAGAH